MGVSNFKIAITIVICLLSIYIALPTFNVNLSVVPHYLKAAPANLGLDLRGGASILLEVEMGEYFKNYSQQNLNQITSTLRSANINYTEAKSNSNGFELVLRSANDSISASNIIKKVLGSNFNYREYENIIKASFNKDVIQEIQKSLVEQSIEVIRRRIDETGTKEIELQRQGDNYILLQVPGYNNPTEIKKLLGKTAKLAFHIVADGITVENLIKSPIRASFKVLEIEEKNHRYRVVVYSRPVLTGEMLIDAQVSFNHDMPIVTFQLNNVGAKIFGDVSSTNIGKAIAIVLDNKILSMPIVKESILSGSGVISGNFSVATANELALLLRAGALPAPLKVVEERVVGPSLGLDSIEAGTQAMIIGIFLVATFMIIFYGFYGFIADLALIMNTFMIIAIFAMFGTTLTLPGIAGIVLTLGIAVDANVLIYERIREESRNGKSLLAAIDSGYKMAFATILDANITTIIAAIILYILGSGSVKSFAVSLTIGIICSMFTAVLLTKIIIHFFYSNRMLKRML